MKRYSLLIRLVTFSIFTMSVVLFSGCGQPIDESSPKLKSNIEVAKRVSLEVVFQGKNADELLSSGFIYHAGATGKDMSRKETLAFWGAFPKAFPDGKITFYNITAQEDLVMFQYTLKGTYSLDIFGAGKASVGKSITTTGYVTRRIVNGKVEEEWDMPNMAGLLGQLKSP